MGDSGFGGDFDFDFDPDSALDDSFAMESEDLGEYDIYIYSHAKLPTSFSF